MKVLIKKLNPALFLYRDAYTGIAWVEDTKTGMKYSCHPYTNNKGSVRSMKALGLWRKHDSVLFCDEIFYNISKLYIGASWDRVASNACQCIKCQRHRIEVKLKQDCT